MKIVLTGGHLAPALAVIENLPKDTEVLYVGRKHALEGDSAFSLEHKTITRLKIPFEEIKTGRMQRKFTPHTIPSLLKLPLGFISAFSILKKFNPDVVIGFGGYVSVPIGIVASLMGIPLVIHEQTLKVGLANKILSKFARKICVSWEEAGKFFPKEKVVLTGLPIRKFQISSVRQAQDKFQVSDKLPLIYITGGSQGSHFINVLVESSINDLTKKFSIIHQTGDAREFGDFERLEKLKKEGYMPIKFVSPSEVGSIMQKASLVIGRSGINTIAEIIRFKKPALLIPVPFLKEQIDNALFFEKLGLGRVLIQKDAESQKFEQIINEMFASLNSYRKSAEKTSGLIKENAAANLIEVVKDVVESKKK